MNIFLKETPFIGYIPKENLIKKDFDQINFDIDFAVSEVEIRKNNFLSQLYFVGESTIAIHDKEVFYLLERKVIPLLTKEYFTFNQVKINFIKYNKEFETKPNDHFDLNSDKINIFVEKDTIVNILSNLNNDQKYKKKIGTLEIRTDTFSTFQSNFKNDKKIICICENKWIKEGNFSEKNDVKLLLPNAKITGWKLNFHNIFEIKKNKGFFQNLFN